VTLSSGFSFPQGIAVDTNGDVLVADTSHSAVKEIPFSGGAYGAPVILGSGFSFPGGVAVDANGDVFVADTNNNAVKEIPYSGGAYGSPTTLGSEFSYPDGVAVDAYGDVFVADTTNGAAKEIPYSGGSLRRSGNAGFDIYVSAGCWRRCKWPGLRRGWRQPFNAHAVEEALRPSCWAYQCAHWVFLSLS
jgi:hypothetical protein